MTEYVSKQRVTRGVGSSVTVVALVLAALNATGNVQTAGSVLKVMSAYVSREVVTVLLVLGVILLLHGYWGRMVATVQSWLWRAVRLDVTAAIRTAMEIQRLDGLWRTADRIYYAWERTHAAAHTQAGVPHTWTKALFSRLNICRRTCERSSASIFPAAIVSKSMSREEFQALMGWLSAVRNRLL